MWPGTGWDIDHSWGQVMVLTEYPHRDWPAMQATYMAAVVKNNPVYYFRFAAASAGCGGIWGRMVRTGWRICMRYRGFDAPDGGVTGDGVFGESAGAGDDAFAGWDVISELFLLVAADGGDCSGADGGGGEVGISVPDDDGAGCDDDAVEVRRLPRPTPGMGKVPEAGAARVR